ncbi:MAG: hypothetical protein LBE91_17605, partial [Tannerella sp.]|nr:hypothetical protein [Tannerella sp.]
LKVKIFVEKLCCIAENVVSLHRVFHGIRFKVNNEDCGCRETTFSFLESYHSGKHKKSSKFC